MIKKEKIFIVARRSKYRGLRIKMKKKIFLTNNFKYCGKVIEENENFILFNDDIKGEVKIYKSQIVVEENA